MTPGVMQVIIVFAIVGGIGFGVYLIIKAINKK